VAEVQSEQLTAVIPTLPLHKTEGFFLNKENCKSNEGDDAI
jgi:hypothetical protein